MPAPKKSQFATSLEKFKIRKALCGPSLFERVLLFRIPSDAEKSETYGDSPIIKVQERITTDTLGTPRCVIVAAGLRAMDIMRANGMRLGDVVWIHADVFTRFETGFFGGKMQEFAFCNLGDVITDESLGERLVSGEMEIAWDGALKRHVVVESDTGLDLGHEQPRHRPDEA